jgi:hypothetical protein
MIRCTYQVDYHRCSAPLRCEGIFINLIIHGEWSSSLERQIANNVKFTRFSGLVHRSKRRNNDVTLGLFFKFVPRERTAHPSQSNLILNIGKDFVNVRKGVFVIGMIVII